MFGVFDRRKNGICSAPSGVRGSRFPEENKREECKRHSRKPKALTEIWSGDYGHSKRLPASSFRAHQKTSGILKYRIRKKRAQPPDYVMVNRLEVSDQCESNGRDSKYA